MWRGASRCCSDGVPAVGCGVQPAGVTIDGGTPRGTSEAAGGTPRGTSQAAGGTPGGISQAAGGMPGGTSQAAGGTPSLPFNGEDAVATSGGTPGGTSLKQILRGFDRIVGVVDAKTAEAVFITRTGDV